MGRQQKLLMETVKNFIPYLYEYGNQYVLKGGTPKEGVRGRLMIRISGDKLHLVGEKIIRGLEFHFRGRVVENTQKIELIIPHEHNEKEIKLISEWEKLILPLEKDFYRGPGFTAKYGVNPTDNDWVIYYIKIWNYLEIWAMIHPKNKIIKGLTRNPDKLNKC